MDKEHRGVVQSTSNTAAVETDAVLEGTDEGEVPSPKRDAIIAAATRVFLANGYGAASMDAIAAEAGVAKQTVYSHFGSKEALFEAIVSCKCEDLMRPALDADAVTGGPGEVLTATARAFLETVLAPDNTTLYRMLIGESTRFPALAEAFYRVGPRHAADGLADYLAEVDRRGGLRVPEPTRSAELFFAMLRGDLYMRRLLDLESRASAAEIEDTVDRAVAAFLAGHALD